MQLALHIGGSVEARTCLGCLGNLGVELDLLPPSNHGGVVRARRAHRHGLMSAVHNDIHCHQAAVYSPMKVRVLAHILES
jgi:hypothetical protein